MVAWVVLGLIAVGRAWAEPNPGIVIEAVAQNSEAAKAGTQARDILLRWTRTDASGEISSPFDLSETDAEQSPQGTVTLKGVRAGQRKWVVGPEQWGLKARPNVFYKAIEQVRVQSAEALRQAQI